MTNKLFNDAKLKIGWAKEKVQEIEGLIRDFIAEQPCGLVVEVDEQSGDRLVKYKLIKPLPIDIIRLVGETAYHLRSALDLMCVALGRRGGLISTKHIHFPFAESKDDWENSSRTRRKVKGLPAEAIAMIADLKPYPGGNDSLCSLNSLANIDKHNWLIPVSAESALKLARNFQITNAKIGLIVGGGGRLDDGIVISNLGRDGTITPMTNDAKMVFTFHVVFGEVDAFKGQAIVPSLLELTKLVARIIEKFEARFSSP